MLMRQQDATPRPARMLAPGRKTHHGAWGGHFAFSGLAAFYLLAQGFYIV
jgi:hypothetical protein